MLVQRRVGLLFAAKDVAETRAKSHLAPPIEGDLRGADVPMGHTDLVDEVEPLKNTLGEVFQDALW